MDDGFHEGIKIGMGEIFEDFKGTPGVNPDAQRVFFSVG